MNFSSPRRSRRRSCDCGAGVAKCFQAAHGGRSAFSFESSKLFKGNATKWLEGGSIPVFVGAQNAGLLVSKLPEAILFEAFEISPRNKDATVTRGRLKRTFPACGVSIPVSLFTTAEFRNAVASAISRMSWQSVSGSQPQVKKAQQMHAEVRDSTDPEIITQYFMTFLVAHGGKQSDTMAISKNTREEVSLKGAKLPWRRLPFWLFLRVSLQIMTCRLSRQQEAPDVLYKEFMLFLIASISQECHRQLIGSDYLMVMNCKLNRRLLKLPVIRQALRQFVSDSMNKTNRILEKRWAEIQSWNSRTLDLSSLKKLNFEADCKVKIPHLDEFIASTSARKCVEVCNVFAPSHSIAEKDPSELPTVPCTSSSDQMTRYLTELEMWVEKSLQSWVKPRKRQDSTTKELGMLMESYYREAAKLYLENAELTSIMVLTLSELWMACDMSAVDMCPLLQEYDPELPLPLLQNLVLPYRDQLERLHLFENYVSVRKQQSKLRCDDIFRNFGSKSSFAVRYYQQSHKHQERMQEILTRAESEKQGKLQEFSRLKARHEDLVRQHRELDCQYHHLFDADLGTSEWQHSTNCQKCQIQRQASSLSIFIYEWPLPSDKEQAEATIFELDVPTSFGYWRDATAFMMTEVFKTEYTAERKPRCEYKLSNCLGLNSFVVPFASKPRIQLLSECKPHVATHRKARKVCLSTETDICLNNGLQLQYFDDLTRSFTQSFRQTDKLPRLCTYRLPEVPSVEKFLFRPHECPSGLSPNSVFASLHECPRNMSHEEYKALCSIPLGHSIQWHNILAQLYAPTVDFKKAETELVLLQCIGQVGPPQNAVLRSNHSILDNCVLAEKLIDGIFQLSQSLEQNCKAASAFGAFISLALHLLSVCQHSHIQRKCQAYLKFSRCVTLRWTMQLKNQVQDGSNSNERDGFRAKAAATALLCAGTFDVDSELLSELFRCTETASTFLQCCIVVQENEALLEDSGPSIALKHHRWKRLCQKVCPVLAHEIVSQSSSALDDAIASSWEAYQGSGRWRYFSAQHSNWLVTDLAQSRSAQSGQVQFNLYTGELLVNGVPLNQLLAKFRYHPTYRRLFGSSIIEVMPSNVPGMQFSSKQKYAEHVLHFGLGDDSGHQHPDLLVQARKDGDEFELVPSEAFRPHFPPEFTENRVHWLNKALQCVEFRPIHEPWKQSDTELLCSLAAESQWRLQTRGQYVIGANSPTARTLSTMFNSVEVPAWTIIDTSPAFDLLYQPSEAAGRFRAGAWRIGNPVQRVSRHEIGRKSRHEHLNRASKQNGPQASSDGQTAGFNPRRQNNL